MVFVIIIIFYGAIVLFDLYRNYKNRMKRENVYYILVVVVSFAILVMKNFDIWNIDFTKMLTELFDSYGLIR